MRRRQRLAVRCFPTGQCMDHQYFRDFAAVNRLIQAEIDLPGLKERSDSIDKLLSRIGQHRTAMRRQDRRGLQKKPIESGSKWPVVAEHRDGSFDDRRVKRDIASDTAGEAFLDGSFCQVQRLRLETQGARNVTPPKALDAMSGPTQGPNSRESTL